MAIEISTQVLRETAGKIEACNATMDEKLQDINKTMNDLENTWSSEGATTIRDAMNALKPRFEEYKEVVASYAKFLVDTATSYETTEEAVSNNASAFK